MLNAVGENTSQTGAKAVSPGAKPDVDPTCGWKILPAGRAVISITLETD